MTWYSRSTATRASWIWRFTEASRSQRLEQVAQQRVEEHQLADRQAPGDHAVAAVPEDDDAGQPADQPADGGHADRQLLQREDRTARAAPGGARLPRARTRSAPNALIVSTPETSSTRWAESLAASSIASRERRRAAGWWSNDGDDQQRHEQRGHQRQPHVVDPQHGRA